MHAQVVAPLLWDGAGLRRIAVAASGAGRDVRNLIGRPSVAHRGEPGRRSSMLAPPRLRPSRLLPANRLQALVVMRPREAPGRHAKLGAVLAFMVLGGTPACACGWWGCSDGYGYRSPTRVYGYTNPRPSAPMRVPTRAQLRSAGPIPGGDVGLEAPIMSGSGILQSAMPARGPSLFGSAPAAPSYYSAPSVRGWQQRRRR